MRFTRLAAVLLVVGQQNAFAGTVVLQKKFIEKYRNRATIDATFIVDHTHAHPNPIKNDGKDGDLHSSGRAKEVGLPMVSEVVNAAQSNQSEVVRALQKLQGTEKAPSISGAWRIWFEHPSTQPQVQFDAVPPAANTNPAHCFEIHPITAFGGQSLTSSFQPIPKFEAYDAETAFKSYENLPVTIKVSNTSVTLRSKKAGYNYVQFYAQLAGKPKATDDGGKLVMVDVSNDPEGEVIVNNVRLIFVPGTPPLKELDQAAAGAQLHVLGIPRVNLNAIWTFITASGPTQTDRKLPYEIIVVAILK